MKHLQTRQPEACRTLSLHGVFAPDGSPSDDKSSFFEFWLAAQSRLTSMKNKDLRRRKLEFANFRRVAEQVGPIFGQVMRNELSPAEAGEKIKLLVRDDRLRRRVFDFWAKIY